MGRGPQGEIFVEMQVRSPALAAGGGGEPRTTWTDEEARWQEFASSVLTQEEGSTRFACRRLDGVGGLAGPKFVQVRTP